MKILLKTALNPYSGYGGDGIGIARALLRMGADVYLDPSFIAPPLPSEVANLLTKRLTAPFDLLIQHADPAQLGISPEARRAAKLVVGWTMWEYTSLDNGTKRSTLRKRLRDFDVLLGYDRVSTGALMPYVEKGQSRFEPPKLGTLQGGYWPDDWPAVSRDWHSDRFGFCMVGALHQRKDPFVAIQAFKELKEEHPEEFASAELHLKTNTPGLHMAMEQWIPKLRVHYNVWSDDVLREFYASQHVLLAPSRGEGKNMPALEFLSSGGTVIATDFGGHQQWLSSEYAYPLRCELVPETMDKPDCKSARASKEHLKELMLLTFRNRTEAQRKGQIASEIIPAMCSWDTVIQRLFERLADLTPAGQPLLHSYRSLVAQRTAQINLGSLVGVRA